MQEAGVSAGFLHIFRNGHDAVVGGQRDDIIPAADLLIQVREKITEIFVQPHKNVLDFAAAGAEFVTDVIHRRVADGEKIRSVRIAQLQSVHSFFGKFGQCGVGVGARGPLLVKGAVRCSDARFSTKRVGKREIPAVGRNGAESFNAYWYGEKALGAVPPDGWDLTFPHSLRGKSGVAAPDSAFYEQWASSPYADTALTELAEKAVDALKLGNSNGTDFLAISYSSVDYVGHEFGPRSREIQDILVRLDKDLGNLFAHLDQKVGRGNYVVALSADHGVVPIPEDMQSTGADAGVLHLPEVQERIEKALESFNYAKPAVARIAGSDVYFAPGVYDKLQQNRAALQVVLDAALAQPGVAAVYRAEELKDRPATQSPALSAFAFSYFPGRSGDLFVLPKPYWLMDSTPAGKSRSYGTGHGVPYNYDQHVPVLLMGFGIQPGQYFQPVTPADIAPTFAALCGITLVSRDGHVLAEALKKPTEARAPTPPARPKSAPAMSPNANP